jgi:transcriptional regulator with XRE-family HTH domain
VDLAVLANAEKARELCASGGFLALRVASHETVRDVARRLGVSAATLSRWEHGIHLPAGDRALALLRVAREMAAEGGR